MKPKKNDWKFKSEPTDKKKGLDYLEWKYFRFKSKKISGFFCYSIGNPDDHLGLKKHIISLAIYHDEEVYIDHFEVGKGETDLSGEREWCFDRCYIRKEKGGWIIGGRSKKVNWELRYTCISGSGVFNMVGGSEDGKKEKKWMDWEIICNSADVNGWIDLRDGEKIPVDGIGYCDSNYGHWRPRKQPWIWLRTSYVKDEVPISFTYFHHRINKKENGILSISDDDYLLSSSNSELSVRRKEGLPEKYSLSATIPKDKLDLDITFRVMDTELLVIRMLRFIPLFRLNLQRCSINLDLELDGSMISFKTDGVAEYPSTKRLF